MFTSQSKLELLVPKAGTIITFRDSDFSTIPSFENGAELGVSLTEDGAVNMSQYLDGEFTVNFGQNITLVAGQCIWLHFNPECVTTPCETTQVDQEHIDETTRFAILDNDNCPVHYITLGQLKNWLKDSIENKPTICDLFDITNRDDFNTGDRVIVLNGSCSMSAVPISEIVCNE
jgi:hypothetical protein